MLKVINQSMLGLVLVYAQYLCWSLFKQGNETQKALHNAGTCHVSNALNQ